MLFGEAFSAAMLALMPSTARLMPASLSAEGSDGVGARSPGASWWRRSAAHQTVRPTTPAIVRICATKLSN